MVRGEIHAKLILIFFLSLSSSLPLPLSPSSSSLGASVGSIVGVLVIGVAAVLFRTKEET